MKKKIFMLIVVSLLAGGIYVAQNLPQGTEKAKEPPKKIFTNDTDDNQPPSKTTSAAKESWGLYPREPGKLPEITAQQWETVRKQGAIFVGDQDKKQIAFTFDMGYEEPGSTDSILKTLKANNIKATFFSTAYWVKKNPDLAKRIIKEGHTMGNHSVNHLSMPTLSDKEMEDEISGWQKAATEATGVKKFSYFRPPMGEYNQHSIDVTRKLGYATVFWSIAVVDWKDGYLTRDQIVNQVTERLHNGAVILLHHKNKDVQSGLDQIIKNAKAKGFKIVPLDQIGKPK